jgi:hypothetical protein
MVVNVIVPFTFCRLKSHLVAGVMVVALSYDKIKLCLVVAMSSQLPPSF